MEWFEDHDSVDGRSLAVLFAVAVAITIGLLAFFSAVMAGVVSWAAAVAGF